MNENHITIAIYGIQDINENDYATLSHDHAIAIMKNGEVIYHGQLERLDRKKYSNRLPEELFTLLKSKKLLQKECDFVFVDNIVGRSFINKEGNIRFEAPLQDSLQNNLEEGRLWWIDGPRKAYALNHELAHIGSCLPFFGEFEDNSLLVHYDGGASQSNFSAWSYKNKVLNLLQANWQLKDLSSLFNANALMFGIIGANRNELNSVPGKLMGFAAYGTYRKELLEWLIKHNFFTELWKSKANFFKQVKIDFNLNIKHLSQKDPFIQDIVATTHHYFVTESLKQFKHLKEKTGLKTLYYSGGTALSIVLNTAIIQSNLFENVYIPPCCNDSGLALGAAAFMEWKRGNSIKIHSPYLNNWNIEEYKTTFNSNTIKEVAELIINNKVVGLCNNMAEIGPRALGNRSIVCLASSKKLANKLSMQIKNREWYRPVAPMILKQNASYFTMEKELHPLSKYMLLDYKIEKNKQKEIEGALHVDQTARIQTINSKEENPFVFELLQYLDNNHQIKALINTSFNAAGEPIVHSIEDALVSGKKMKLDAVVLNGKVTLLN